MSYPKWVAVADDGRHTVNNPLSGGFAQPFGVPTRVWAARGQSLGTQWLDAHWLGAQ